MKMYSKTYILFASALLFISPLTAFAGWQVSNPGTTVPSEPFFQTGRAQQKTDYKASVPYTPHIKKSYSAYLPAVQRSPSVSTHQMYSGQIPGVYAVSISGSVKENLERIMGRYHWKVVWKAPFDYNFDGRVTGSSLPNVIEKLLQPFPLQAVMYMSNRTLAVVPRIKT